MWRAIDIKRTRRCEKETSLSIQAAGASRQSLNRPRRANRNLIEHLAGHLTHLAHAHRSDNFAPAPQVVVRQMLSRRNFLTAHILRTASV
jgi:hypothetical protein